MAMSSSKTIIPRRITESVRCANPIFYVSTTSTPSSATQIHNGMQSPGNTVYLFAASETVGTTLNWTIKIYYSGGTVQSNTSGTTAIGSSFVNPTVITSRSLNIPTGGRLEFSGYCSKSGISDSHNVSNTIYSAKQTITLEIAPTTGTQFDHYGMVEIKPMNCTYGDCNVYYTTNGNTPTQSSTLYNPQTLITLTSNATVKAKAFDRNGIFNDSSVYTASYTVSHSTLQPPTISPIGTTSNTSIKVTISNPNTQGKIYYTTNGDTPTVSSSVYDDAITLHSSCTVKAIVIISECGCQSTVASQTYTISSEPTLTLEVLSITGDSAVLKGTLTYDSSVYQYGNPSYYLNIPHGGPRLLTWFDITPLGSSYATYSAYTYTPDCNLNISEVINYQPSDNTVTRTFFYVLDTELPMYNPYLPVSTWEVEAKAKIYYAENGSVLAKDVSSTSEIVYFKTARKQYSITSSQITGRTYSYNGQYTLKAFLSPVNVSFSAPSSYSSPSDKKYWGRRNFTFSSNTTPQTSIQVSVDYLKDPWSYIGSDSANVPLLGFNDTDGVHYSNTTDAKACVRDLFGWGTSGNNYSSHSVAWQPYSVSTTDSDYNAYNDSTKDLRNVRSAVLQTNPAEPNSLTGSSFRSPKMWNDWAMIGIFSDEAGPTATQRIWMWNTGDDGYGWYLTWESNQGNNRFLNPRAYAMVSRYNWQNRDKVATLSKDEWSYMLFTRSGNRFAKGRIQCTDYYGHTGDYVNGLFIFSDDWSSSNTTTFNNINSTSASYTSNTITEAQWNDTTKEFENSITFLPAAGYRVGTSVSGSGTEGYYWTGTCDQSDTTQAYAVHFNASTVEIVGVPKSRGCAVRLGRYVYTEV